MAEFEDHPVELRGAVLSLWSCFADEVLVVGAAFTGKTRGLLERSLYISDRWPGVRQLWVRQTLRSLRQSVLVTWETEVIWPGHPCMHGKAQREHRDLYRWPNGAETVLAGADTPEKFLSAQYDIIWLWEAREMTPDTVQVLSSRNRNGVLPWQQMVFDTNPGPRTHHLNKRFPLGFHILPDDHPSRIIRPGAEEDQQVRLLSRHEDNPAFYDSDGNITPRGMAYQRKLDRLVGARRRNLRDGVWASEEGVIWEEYDEDIHLIEPRKVPPLVWYFFSFDKGIRHPGCLQVWGVDGDDRMYRVVEVYRVGMEIDWWADVVVELDNEFRPQAAVSDHHPEWITKFNDVLNEHGRHRIFKNANKDRDVGIQTVQKGLSLRNDGPRIFLVRGALRYGRCPIRDEALKPACTEEEILDYVWAKHDDGQISREVPDPLCADHGCDALRYAAMFRWKKDLAPRKRQQGYPEGTLGHLFGHDRILGPEKRARERVRRFWRGTDTH